MTLWIAIAVTLALACAWIARPLLRRAHVELSESEHAVSIFRDQLDEVARDAALGLISQSQRDQAEREIKRRTVRAARAAGGGIAVSRRSVGLALGAVAITAAGSLGLYLTIGSPGAADQPLAERRALAERRLAALADTAARDTVAQNGAQPTDESDAFEGWWIRARAHAARGDYAAAAEAYRRAAALSGDAPSVVSAYAEALTLANGNRVPAAARLVFEQVLAREPTEPRARYYLALAKAQQKDFEGAMQAWLALLAESDPDAPWSAMVRRDIANMARFLDRDPREVLPELRDAELAGRDGGSGAGAPRKAVPAADASRPDWGRAIAAARERSRAGDPEAARELLEAARADYANAPFVARQIDAELAALDSEALGARGPTPEQVAAAAEMSQGDRDQMVRSMVDGLATRLRSDPSDLDGWLMLIRSYAVLQDRERAEAAVRSALRAFSSGPARRELLRSATELGLVVN